MNRTIFRFLLAGILFLLGAQSATAQVCFGQPEKFNDAWRFTLSDPEGAGQTQFDDQKWQQVLLPHDWSVKQPLSPSLASCTGYLPGGIGWYRKHFTAPSNSPANWYIYFEGIYNRSEVYLNGHLLGKRPNGYVSFLYDMTPLLNRGGNNVLAVRGDHSQSADSRWYTGSGIYRDVWVVTAPEIHLAQWGVTYRTEELTDKRATVAVDIAVDKSISTTDRLDVTAALYDATGRRVAQATGRVTDGATGISEQTLTLRITAPHRWDISDPYLYTLRTELRRAGKTVDSCSVRAGLRSLTFDPDRGFALNERWMKVKGVCLHHDAGVLGAAVPKEVWLRRLENLKSIGVNAVRMSHNPQAPVVYDLCDELGLLVMDEAFDEWRFPKRKWIEGWNVGTPGFQGSSDFFEAWSSRDITDMVLRDRNHPSIFMWSIGNEVDYPNDPYSHPVLDGTKISQPMFGGYKKDAPDARELGDIAKRLAACVREIDRSRPVTAALAGVVMSNETEYPAAVDITGYNYTEDRYATDHAAYPERVIYGSENRPDIDAWKAVRDNEFIFGQFIWTGTDYLGESGSWPSRGFYTGLLDFGSFVKPRGHYRASLWCERPVTYIGTYPATGDHLSVDAWDIWNYNEGQTIRVVCYTNAPQARLRLDGCEVGAMKPYDDTTGIIWWDIPYTPGELRAEGCDADGNVLSDHTIRTSGRPYALRVHSEGATTASGVTTAHLVVEVVDQNGVRVMLGDNEIACTIEGPARLLGLEAGNNTDMSDHTDNRHRAYHGRLLAYVQTFGKQGDIRVHFTSPLLQGTEAVLSAH